MVGWTGGEEQKLMYNFFNHGVNPKDTAVGKVRVV
jgi:hypothetical protein